MEIQPNVVTEIFNLLEIEILKSEYCVSAVNENLENIPVHMLPFAFNLLSMYNTSVKIRELLSLDISDEEL